MIDYTDILLGSALFVLGLAAVTILALKRSLDDALNENKRLVDRLTSLARQRDHFAFEAIDLSNERDAAQRATSARNSRAAKIGAEKRKAAVRSMAAQLQAENALRDAMRCSA